MLAYLTDIFDSSPRPTARSDSIQFQFHVNSICIRSNRDICEQVWKAALGLATATRQLAGLAAITVEGLPKREYNSVYLPTLTQPGASGLLVPLSGEDSWRQDGENRERMAKKRAKMGEIWPKKKRAGGR